MEGHTPWLDIQSSRVAEADAEERDVKTRRLYRLSLNRGNSVAIIQLDERESHTNQDQRDQPTVLRPAGICLSKLRREKHKIVGPNIIRGEFVALLYPTVCLVFRLNISLRVQRKYGMVPTRIPLLRLILF